MIWTSLWLMLFIDLYREFTWALMRLTIKESMKINYDVKIIYVEGSALFYLYQSYFRWLWGRQRKQSWIHSADDGSWFGQTRGCKSFARGRSRCKQGKVKRGSQSENHERKGENWNIMIPVRELIALELTLSMNLLLLLNIFFFLCYTHNILWITFLLQNMSEGPLLKCAMNWGVGVVNKLLLVG